MAQPEKPDEKPTRPELRVRMTAEMAESIETAKQLTGITTDSDLVRHAILMLVKRHKADKGGTW